MTGNGKRFELVIAESDGKRLLGIYHGSESGLRANVAATVLVDLTHVVELSSVETYKTFIEESALTTPGPPAKKQTVLTHDARPHMPDVSPCPRANWTGYITGFTVVRREPELVAKLYRDIHFQFCKAGDLKIAEAKKAAEEATKKAEEGKGDAG